MARLLADFPFLILLLAGAIACVSAGALRRVAPIVGAWTKTVAAILRLAGCACFAFSFFWAWDLGASRLFSGVVSTFGSYPRPVDGNESSLIVTGLGLLVLLAGLGLVAWGLSVKGWAAALTVRPPRLTTTLPYARIKRPIGLGMILAAAGFMTLAQSLPVLVCLLGGLPWMILVLELEEREMRAGHPEAREYLMRTPRYIPLLRMRR